MLFGAFASVQLWLFSWVAGFSQHVVPLKNDSEFFLVGEVRPRAEFRNGFKRLRDADESAAFFIEQRSRLYFDYQQEKLSFRLTLQDVRIWGNTDQIFKSDPALQNVREAWGEYSFSRRAAFKVGRQTISYDNERFLGGVEWAQQGRAHDALLFKIKNDSSKSELHVGLAFNQNVLNEPTRLSGTYYAGVNNYKTMQYLWLHKEFHRGVLSLLGLTEGRQNMLDSVVNFLYTIGTYGQFSISPKARVAGEYYHQAGKNVAGQTVDGYLAAISMTFGSNDRMPLSIGGDYVSGTSSQEARNTSFDPSFGTNHSLYGTMDYFYGGNPHGQNGRVSGLVDAYVKTSYNVSIKSTMKADLHYFSSAAAVYDPEQQDVELSRYLGIEIDLAFIVKLSDDVLLQGGYSQMFGTSALEVVKEMKGERSVSNNWVWLMVTIKPLLVKRATLNG